MNTETSTQPAAPANHTSRSGYPLAPPPEAVRAYLAARLTAEERRVILHQGTERPFCGIFVDNHRDGLYTCKLCGLPLFRSAAKFDSGTGWPSFFEPADPAHIRALDDASHGMRRTEIRCGRCDAHLGHVFPDGPPPSGLRYCLNSISLGFHPQGSEPPRAPQWGA